MAHCWKATPYCHYHKVAGHSFEECRNKPSPSKLLQQCTYCNKYGHSYQNCNTRKHWQQWGSPTNHCTSKQKPTETKADNTKTEVPDWTKFKNYRRNPADEKSLVMSATSRFQSTRGPVPKPEPASTPKNSYFTLIAVR